jgi:hypothetical protein
LPTIASSKICGQPEFMGGKHGGQAGMPKPEDRSSAQQGIVRDEKGQEQPADKARAQHVSRKDRGDDPPGDPKQR